MPSSLVRGKYLISKVENGTAQIIENGAVLQRDGRIVEVGDFDALVAYHPREPILGGPNHVLLPGFVNGHHHVGLTPFQLGSPDLALELWIAHRMRSRNVDYYLDTLYSAFEMIESGVTTVQHLRGFIPGRPQEIHAACESIIKAYQDIGMRVSYSYFLRDQNRLVYEDDAVFLTRLPADLRKAMKEFFDGHTISLDESFGIFDDLYRKHQDKERVRIQLGPANLHWCSDAALTRLAEFAQRRDACIHMHLLETVYQKAYAHKRTGITAVEHLNALGLLGPRMTLGHGVWLTEADIERVAATDTRICHNCSSNLRLRSGVAPLNAFERQGVRVAIGLDEAGINDDRDMLQEMRMVLRQHRVPGMADDDVPSSAQVLRMATEDGALTTPFGSEIGRIEPGRAADLVLMDWRQISYPYLDPETSIVDAVLYRAKTSGVDTVIVAGETIYKEGHFTCINKADAIAQLARSLEIPLSAAEVDRAATARKVFTHVKRFYDDYLAGVEFDPFYRPSSRR